MTKKKLHESVLELCTEHKASKKLTDALSDLTAPKVGGSSDVSDYTVFGEDGNPEFIFCTYHKRWEPVVAVNEEDEEFNLFSVDAKSKNGFSRSCDMGASQWKDAAKIFKNSKDAVMTDVLDGELTGPEGKAAIVKLEEARKVITLRTDGLGTEDRPEA